jgi:hypothetical protein
MLLICLYMNNGDFIRFEVVDPDPAPNPEPEPEPQPEPTPQN